jgi:hypothetical protein
MYGEQTMPNETHVEKPSSTEELNTAKTEQDKKIDRIAEQAAEKASKTEKHYDQGHDIFTK